MTLATCSKDIKLYSWPSLNLSSVYETCENIKTISWSNDGKYLLAIKSKENPIVLTTPFSGEQNVQILKNSNAKSGKFSNSSNTSIGFGDADGSVYIYDMKKRKKINEYQQVGAMVNFVDFSYEDTCLGVGCSNGQIILYGSNQQPCASYMVSCSRSLSAMTFNKFRSDLLAAASKEGIMNVWNTTKGVAVVNGREHTGIITDLVFMGENVTSVGNDGKMVIYDMRSVGFSSSHNLNAPLSSVAYQNTNEIAISTCDGQIRSYDKRCMSAPINNVIAYETPVRQIRFQPNKMTPFNSRPTTKGSEIETKNHRDMNKPPPPSAGDFNQDFSPSSSTVMSSKELENMYALPPSASQVHLTSLRNTRPSTSASPPQTMSISYDEFVKFSEEIEAFFESYKRKMEEKMLAEFYTLRIEMSKQFIDLQEKIERNWGGFMNYLKMTNIEGNDDGNSTLIANKTDESDVVQSDKMRKSRKKR